MSTVPQGGGGLSAVCHGIGDDGRFLLLHTGRGADVSPAFTLAGLAPEARTLAVVLEDLSHPIPSFTHWILWDLPAAPEIPGSVPPGRILPALGGARQGLAYGPCRYAGPKPPKGRSHTYRFTICALDRALGPGLGKRRFRRMAQGHILQTATVEGVFG